MAVIHLQDRYDVIDVMFRRARPSAALEALEGVNTRLATAQGDELVYFALGQSRCARATAGSKQGR
ncbi:hypothetical protein [Streptomyces sp. NBC_01497]|uniref:hypothetical protein n=1 Tax=Streptomyces sp. NBC_01497 TaxID=2903885 RepID=UPI002E3043AF|nr:hypothetical protein [Streptomyces sp. NBC_01497]